MNIKMNEKPDSVLKEYPTVEVPLPKGKSVSRGLAWISLIMPSVTFLTMLFIIYAVKSQDLSQLTLLIFPSVCAANPNGYEMIFADNSYSNISVICIIGGMVIGIMLFLSLTYPIWENLL